MLSFPYTFFHVNKLELKLLFAVDMKMNIAEKLKVCPVSFRRRE